MANELLNQTTFSVYELFSNIIPGTLIILSLLYITGYAQILDSNLLIQSLLLVALVFIAFTVGLAVQGISATIEKYINKHRYGVRYPSDLYLLDTDKSFPPYFKASIKRILKQKFATSDDVPVSHLFDLCYTYVMQKKLSNRVSDFLRTYTFARNMMLTMIIEAACFFYLAYINLQGLFALTGFASIVLSYVFYKRFVRYGESFAKEVLKSFFIEEAAIISNSTTES